MAEKKNKQISEEQLNRNYGRAYTLIRPLFRFLFPFRRVHAERIPDHSVLICPNHFSDLDPLTVCFALPKHSSLRVMAKQELLDAPVLGRLCGDGGFLASSGATAMWGRSKPPCGT